MKMFLSSLENQPMAVINKVVDNAHNLKWNLMSFYYCRSKKAYEKATYIKEHSEIILIDSGAHSFQHSKKKVDIKNIDAYVDKYAEFIRKFDDDKVLGYFEMDIDKEIGYEKVLEYRKKLEAVTDKIIPVWHDCRGIDEYIRMTEEYSGKIIAISGFAGRDIKDHQFAMFLKQAKKNNCKLHCLGMTREKVIKNIPFDFVDSSTWAQDCIYGRIDNYKISKKCSKEYRDETICLSYLQAMRKQATYYQKWRKVCKD